jgi:hypothetical protein
MRVLRAAALASIVAWTAAAHAGSHRRLHDEAGLLVGIGIFADFVGASVLLDLIDPPEPDFVCADGIWPNGDAPSGCARADVGMRHCAEPVWTCAPWWR